jgi:hypothetical protein
MFETGYVIKKLGLTDEMLEDIKQIALIKYDYDEILNEKIKIYPCHTNRCSQLGEPCERKLFFFRTRWEDTLKYEIELQQIFDLGKYLEPFIKQKLQEKGYEVTGDQRSYHDRTLNLTGSKDMSTRHPKFNNGKSFIPTELKTCHESVFNSVNTWQDILNSIHIYFRGYYTQVQGYMYLEGNDNQNKFPEKSLLVLLNKSNGQIKEIPVYFDMDFVETNIMKKCERINAYVKSNIIPPCSYLGEHCEQCSFRAICDVKKQFDGAAFLKDSDLATDLIKRAYLEPKAKEFEAVDKKVKERIKLYNENMKKEILYLDNFEINIRNQKRKTYDIPDEVKIQFRVEDSEFPVIKIREISNNLK